MYDVILKEFIVNIPECCELDKPAKQYIYTVTYIIDYYNNILIMYTMYNVWCNIKQFPLKVLCLSYRLDNNNY